MAWSKVDVGLSPVSDRLIYGTFTKTFTTKPQLGDLIVVTGGIFKGAGGATLAMSDGANTWSSIHATNNPAYSANGRAVIAYTIVTSVPSGTWTITGTLTGLDSNASEGTFYFSVFRGGGTLRNSVSFYPAPANTTTLTGSSQSGIVGDLVIASMQAEQWSGNAGISNAQSGYSQIGVQQNASVGPPHQSAWKIATGDGAQAASWTFNTAVVCAGVVAVFQGETGAVQPTPTDNAALVPVLANGHSVLSDSEARLYGPGKTVITGLWNMDVKGTDEAVMGFEAPISGTPAKIRVYYADNSGGASGYAGGTGGDIGIALRPESGGLPDYVATPIATGRRRPAVDFSMSGGIYGTPSDRFAQDTLTAAGTISSGSFYYLTFKNNDASPTVNWSCVDLSFVPLAEGKPNRWLQNRSWRSLLKRGSTYQDWTTGGNGGGRQIPILEIEMTDGRKFGISPMAAGNIPGRIYTFTSTTPFRERFTPSANKVVTGFTVWAAKSAGTGGLGWQIIRDSDSVVMASGVINQTTNDYTTTNQVYAGSGIYPPKDIALASPITWVSGQTYNLVFTPQGSSEWKKASQQNGSGYGFAMPAAFTESRAQHFYSGSWINANVYSLTTAGSGDTNWRVVMHLQATGAPTLAITSASPMGSTIALAGTLSSSTAGGSTPSNDATGVNAVTVFTGLAYPWAVQQLPNGRFLVTEKLSGKIRLINGGIATDLTGVPSSVIATGDQHGGMMDLILDSNFASNRTIYFTHVTGSDGANRVSVKKATLASDDLSISGVTEIFSVKPDVAGSSQYGGRLAEAPDGTLYLATGDRDGPHNPTGGQTSQMLTAQDDTSQQGKVLRFTKTGTVPADNPYASDANANKKYVFAKGFRNPLGLAIGPDGNPWLADNGPGGGDEINRVRAGLNYGWPNQSYGSHYGGANIPDVVAGVEPPAWYTVTSAAPSGMLFIQGNTYGAGWRGNCVFGNLANWSGSVGARVSMLKPNSAGTGFSSQTASRTTLWNTGNPRCRDVRQGTADGKIYVITDESNGRLVRLDPVFPAGTTFSGAPSVTVSLQPIGSGTAVGPRSAAIASLTWSTSFDNVAPGVYRPTVTLVDWSGTASAVGNSITVVGLSGGGLLPDSYTVTGIVSTPNVLTGLVNSGPQTITVTDQNGLPVASPILSSNNTSVASVTTPGNQDGTATVTLKAAGQATITITYQDASAGLVTTTVVVQVTTALPSAPTGLTVAITGQTTATLSATGIAANGSTIRWERSSTSGLTGFAEIGSTPAGTPTFEDSGLSPATQYWWRARVRNASGDSDYSVVATGTTQGLPTVDAGLHLSGIRVGQWLGSTITYAVQILDGDGLPVSGTTVTASSSSPAVVSVGASANTNASGVATFTLGFLTSGRSNLTFTHAASGTTGVVTAISRTL